MKDEIVVGNKIVLLLYSLLAVGVIAADVAGCVLFTSDSIDRADLFWIVVGSSFVAVGTLLASGPVCLLLELDLRSGLTTVQRRVLRAAAATVLVETILGGIVFFGLVGTW